MSKELQKNGGDGDVISYKTSPVRRQGLTSTSGRNSPQSMKNTAIKNSSKRSSKRVFGKKDRVGELGQSELKLVGYNTLRTDDLK